MEKSETIREALTRCLNYDDGPCLPSSFMDFVGTVSILYCYVLLSSDRKDEKTDELKTTLVSIGGEWILRTKANMYMDGFLRSILDKAAENEDGLPFPYYLETIDLFNEYTERR